MNSSKNVSTDNDAYRKLISLWQEAQNELTCAQILIDQADSGLKQATPHLIHSWYCLIQLELARNGESYSCKSADSFSSFQQLIPAELKELVKETKRQEWIDGLGKVFEASQNWWQCQCEETIELDYRLMDFQQNCLDRALSDTRTNLDRQFGKNVGAILQRNWKWLTALTIIALIVAAFAWNAVQQKLDPKEGITSKDLSQKIVVGGAWNAPGNKQFQKTLEINLTDKVKISSIDVALDNNDVYHFEYYDGKKYNDMITIGPSKANRGGMVRYQQKLKTITIPTSRIRITAISGDGSYSIGHLRLK